MTPAALSIRQPWAWLIVNGFKDVENRTWPTLFRGRFLVHASSGMSKEEYSDCVYCVSRIDPKVIIPSFRELARGGIVGEATIYGCMTDCDSPWFFGPFGFLIKDAKPLPFVRCRGMLGFFKPNL